MVPWPALPLWPRAGISCTILLAITDALLRCASHVLHRLRLWAAKLHNLFLRGAYPPVHRIERQRTENRIHGDMQARMLVQKVRLPSVYAK